MCEDCENDPQYQYDMRQLELEKINDIVNFNPSTTDVGIVELAKLVSITNQNNGWWELYKDGTHPFEWSDPRNLIVKLALVITECSEAIEAIRNDDEENFDEEIADIFIRLMEIIVARKTDIAAQIIKKNTKNASRGNKHGGKKV